MRKRRILPIILLCFAVVAAGLVGGSISGEAVRIESIQEYRIAGTILRTTDGKPLDDLTVKVFAEESIGADPIAMARTNTNGKYVVKIRRDSFPRRSRSRAHKVFLRVFDRRGQQIKSMSQPIVMEPGADLRVDLSLLSSEVEEARAGGDTCSLRVHKALSLARNRLSPPQLLEAYLQWQNGVRPFSALNSTQQEFVNLLSQDNPSHDCGESFFTAFTSLLQQWKEAGESKELIARIVDPLFDKQFFTEHVVVRYRATSTVGVPAGAPAEDSELRMPNGILVGYVRANLQDLNDCNTEVAPVYIQQVGLIAEHAWNYLVNRLSFRDPRGDKGRIEIRIQPISGATGQTSPNPLSPWVEIRPNNTLDQNFSTVPHEIFHRVQYQYNSTADPSGIYGVLREGGARFIEDSFNDDYNRYVFQSQEIFNSPGQSLITPADSCENPIGYAAALFWKYVAEQHSKNTNCNNEPHIGIDTYQQILETTMQTPGAPSRPYEVTSLRTACERMARPGSFDEFQYFDEGKTELDSTETTWGNYLVANYVHGNAVPPGERRFKYQEDQDIVTWPLTAPPELPNRVTKLATLSPMISPEDAVVLRQGSTVSRTVAGQLPYAARYYHISPSTSPAPRTLSISFSAFGGMTDPLVQILRFGTNGDLTDISKSDRPSHIKTINLRGVSSVVVIVGSRMNGGDYTLTLNEIEGGPDVMITRWDSGVRTEYELNPRDYSKTRTSPDLMVDNDYNREPDRTIAPGIDNKLNVRLHNRGNSEVQGVSIELQFQPWVARLDPALWRPVQNAENVTQTITDIRLQASGDPRDRLWSIVNWAPPANGSSSGWCLKATVRSPRDLNSDNKTAIGCFAQSSTVSTR